MTLLYNPNFNNPFFQKNKELYLKDYNDVELQKQFDNVLDNIQIKNYSHLE